MKNKLICLPHAGGDTSLFREMTEAVNDEIACYTLDYSGHGRRNKLPYYNNWDELTTDIAALIGEIVEPNDDYVLLGYSMGTMAVYELLARKLLEHAPMHLVLCSHEEPEVRWFDGNFAALTDDEVADLIRNRGGINRIDEKTLQNRVFRRMYFEPIKRDYELISNYRKTECEPIDIPYTIMYSPEDISAERIRSWDNILSGPGEYIEFSGKHFFIKKHPAEVAKTINNIFEQLGGTYD